jgi:hypothetical protein
MKKHGIDSEIPERQDPDRIGLPFALPIEARWSEYHGCFTLIDANGNYVANIQVYQTPRVMGLYDEGRRRASAKFIVDTVNTTSPS